LLQSDGSRRYRQLPPYRISLDSLKPRDAISQDRPNSSPGRGIHNAFFLANNPSLTAGVGRERMFNIVKHRDFMLADNVPTWREAENLRLEKYGHDYLVVIRAEVEPDKEPAAPAA
jgi:hypothetical protein